MFKKKQKKQHNLENQTDYSQFNYGFFIPTPIRMVECFGPLYVHYC